MRVNHRPLAKRSLSSVSEMIVTKEKKDLIKKIMKDEELFSLLLLSIIVRTDMGDHKLLDSFRKMEELGVL